MALETIIFVREIQNLSVCFSNSLCIGLGFAFYNTHFSISENGGNIMAAMETLETN